MLAKVNKRYFIFFLLTFLLTSCSTSRLYSRSGQSITPFDYGLSRAKTGEERYWALYKAHSQAVSLGVHVDYNGIKQIDISIPQGANSIPLSYANDFSNVIFNVQNNQKDLFLFSLIQKPQDIQVSKSEIDKGRFSNVMLRNGRHLLIITDENPWVKNRSGYSYGHIRKDVLLVNNGESVNQVIMPYNNAQSNPSCQVYSQTDKEISISNVSLIRDEGSTFKTFLFNIVGYDNIKIANVKIKTPSSSLTSDTAIRIADCSNVVLEDVNIDGTYSQKRHSGYGISLNNVWNFTAIRLTGLGNWGIFGNNNINLATLTDCMINRFDVHCYGRDVYFNDTQFVDCYNQFSSVFGGISFVRCSFKRFIPVLYERSYNSYVGHDILFKDCTFFLTKGNNYLISAGLLDNTPNSRKELAEKCWPNVTVDNMTVIVEDNATEMNVFRLSKEMMFKSKVGYVSSLSIKGMDFKYSLKRKPIKLYLSNTNVDTKNVLSINIEDVNLSPLGEPVEGVLRTNLNNGLNNNLVRVKRSRISNQSSVK